MGIKKLTLAQKINVLRASVMGANDGIISVAGIVLGVAGANQSSFAILISGFAGMLAGTVSMAMGEYVSVHSQKDAEISAIKRSKQALNNDYDQQFNYVKSKLVDTGIPAELAHDATNEMMQKSAVKTLVREKYGFEIDDQTSPYAAALASMISFPLGSLLPLLSILVIPKQFHILGTMIAVLISLVFTGYFAAILSHSNRFHGTIRNLIAGLLTMVVTYYVGTLFSL
ncbi:integral membrane protein [Ligilactobacillus hayakitensis DSM 18933 = JCM 14209]|uniref:Integral membrane protein n=1 Tax=Ligilactobacillus hayakitensis DSM 18933 = JCM 14209 TaxID=1423755 RepID=A0A0R1WMX5_9LACO|nr:VIT family protein [Ligilactobacillus hayakitensis]KRM19232.1 integral membrane protein [Ligilactobacillus hayakitensis DSM 18933 = JCM 14209]